ncbi:carbonic anhydrase [Planctomyces sp. SH-PL62]|uniref:carbonic anhydrase n=1 Tax=Planctomyces sp. SH-PL62 TaxID=1636152 RepID=UPI00078BB047|nr:carbonic anhydrase [Planctomyces sp. SH-PL62]AMV37036.1 Carbonic anhydrase [Planctomyces sp. SH-PL62]
MIDYTFRYEKAGNQDDQQPSSSEEAREALQRGNRVFSEWMRTCRASPPGTHEQFVIPCGGLSSIFSLDPTEFPTQKPFALVLGCSDARVPTEMLFGQGFNDLFVVRNAGNVLSDVVLGSIDFTVRALSDSVRVIVVLGHTNCGAVKGAVNAYLNPGEFWSESYSPNLRLIFQRIFVAVRESDNIIREVWGPDAASQPGYRDALIEAAVCMNAAHSAFAIRQEVEADRREGIEVLFGVYDVRTYQVCMPTYAYEPAADHVNLAPAPKHPQEMAALAREIATYLKPGAKPASPPREG